MAEAKKAALETIPDNLVEKLTSANMDQWIGGALNGAAAGLKCPPPGLRTAPHAPAWCPPGLRPLLRTPQRHLSRFEAWRGPRSAPQAAPKLSMVHSSTARRRDQVDLPALLR